MPQGRDGRNDIAEKLKETAEYLVELVAAQMRLTRLELLGDARSLGTHLARLLAFAPPLLFGYGFLVGAAALGLSRITDPLLAVLAVGLTQLAVGVWGMLRVLRALRRVRLLDRSRSELARSVAVTRPPGPEA